MVISLKCIKLGSAKVNKSIIKNFAIRSRKELKVKIKASLYDMGKGKIESLNEKDDDAYNKIIEETAYIWFNRFISIRFMEVNHYISTKIGVLSCFNPADIGMNILAKANDLKFNIDNEKIDEMKLNANVDELFKYIIITEWNSLNKILPCVFKNKENYVELLFPHKLIKEGSFIKNLLDKNIISENDWKDIEIIGWLYEYYELEEKNRITKSKKKYTKEEIPCATQLFTPDWIVKYMVQNSLGRYWIESHPEHNDLKEKWEFYIENSEKKEDIGYKLKPYIDKKLKVEQIKCFDPACGSGHILIYMFDLLYDIYVKCGYKKVDIPTLIIENNLYGLDIDDRACQLARFSIIMRGMRYDKELLNNTKKKSIRFNIVSIQETNSLGDKDIAYIAGKNSGENYERTKSFIENFKDAKIYGSLIQLDKFNMQFFKDRLEYIKDETSNNVIEESRRKKVLRLMTQLIKQSEIMLKTYDILVANPPYIGNKYLNPLLAKYIGDKYPEGKSDIFSAFIVYSFSKVKVSGQLGFMTPFVWMFIQSYKKLRKIIVDNKNINNLIQLEYSAFEEATVPICTFTLRNYNAQIKENYIKLSRFKGVFSQPEKVKEAINNPVVDYRYEVKQGKMKNIPQNRFGYWLTDSEIQVLNEAKVIADVSFPCTGMQTGNNDKYVRQWFEVEYETINFTGKSNRRKYWIPYQMGGDARKWYGNISEVVYWKDNGEKLKEEKGAVIRNERFYFKRGISWKRITSGNNTIRVLNEGFIFDQSADSIFVKNKPDYNYILAFFNTKIMRNIFEFISPTLNLTAGTVKQIPIYMDNNIIVRKKIDSLCKECIVISKLDWDFFEISWNFTRHPLLSVKSGKLIVDSKQLSVESNENPKNTTHLSDAFNAWKIFTDKQFARLKSNEEELNRIFIEIYGLKNELTPEVPDGEMTIRKADLSRDIKSFISYAVGCMFGRYSLDVDGIVYAGGNFHNKWKLENEKWKVKSEKSDAWFYSTFSPDEDNIIPVLSEHYFEDDIVDKFVQFVSATFGEEKLSENLQFIAKTLGKKSNETDEDTIRRYFVCDFFKDHVKMYKKRPIYWMFTSGKEKTFNCLVYMHRYDKDTLSKISIIYIRKLKSMLYKKRKELLNVMEEGCGCFKKKKAKKELLVLLKKIDELEKYDAMMKHMDFTKIEINLDKGVKTNYKKFKEMLCKI
ncbi:conserved hypothetical protein [Clostridium ljungdahlii DSM 13528]|uniref:site-specific DNA-methyltransferase (adenine-specific) n=1 Tax=Clostridium ljungdahlii (strain ATCC 55383 / DSM 13528 / PETC) TaxID=748727 RepID=D8GLV4_CLOLD|nr:conserved hypothetical protein [Clostridium ljungdahlii DSM 13528]